MTRYFYNTIIAFVIIVIGQSSYAQKTDTIIHINGNVLLGEIKKLDYGIITFKMDGMGTLKVELNKVNTFGSKKHFQIILKSGMKYYGSFDTSAVKRTVKILLVNGSEVIPIDDIVEVYPIKRSFWLRTSGTFSLGFNFSKGSGIASLTSSGNLNYRNRKSYTVLNWNENTTMQSDTINSNKTNLSFNFQRLIIRKWYFGLNCEASSNTELGVDLRILAGASIINYLVHNNHNRFYLSVGGSGNKEWSEGKSTIVNSIEGLLGLNYHYFKYTDPEISVTTYLNAYPNFTTANRWRINYSLDAKVEVFNNFDVGINFYYDFDNKPISTEASTHDYGITTTLSFSFH